MAMVSPRLQHDIDRRVRAAYSFDQDRGLCDDTHRTPSVPGALRHHRREESHRAVTAPAGYRGRRGSTARARLILLAKHVRTARSESPPPMQCGRERRTGQRIPSTTGPRASAAASVLDAEAPLPSEDSSSGIGTGDQSEQGSPLLTADVREKAGSREKEGAVTSDFGTPKLMELMEERDRAVHLCLQYRCKLKNTEGSLRAEERLASDLKSQLREANAAGDATRKLFDQVMDRVRADEGRKLRQETGTRKDEHNKASFAEEARKTRLQLVRARKDLRELWLERDELAMLAAEATKGEQAGCKRVKKLELALSGLREQVAALALSEQKAAETTARAEARAAAAEAAESELRKAVEVIKHDFEALVRDLRLREKTIRQLEAKNATLAVRSSTTTLAPHDRIRSRQSSADAGKSTESYRTATLPTRRVSSQGESGSKEADDVLGESRDSSVDKPPAGAPDTQENGACGVAAPNPHATSLGQSSTTANAPIASVTRPARKQLTPKASEIPGRLTTISYPRCGSRATFTPMAAPKDVAVINDADDPLTPQREAREEDAKEDDETTLKIAASPVLAQAAGKVPNDFGRPARRNESHDKELGTTTWTSDEEQPSPRQHQPIERTDALDHSPSSHGARQPQCRLSFSEEGKVLPNDPPSSCTVEMPHTNDANDNVGAAVGHDDDAEDVGGGGRDGDGETQTERGESVECGESSDGLVDGAGKTAVALAPARVPATTAGNGELDCSKHLTTDGGVGGVEHEAKLGLEVDVESSVPPRLDEVGAGSETPVFRSRLVDGVPVLKYGGGRGKTPKPKVLWVTPDLSEIFYTQMGRTKNSKKSSHMPLAGLCASRGRRDCPDLLRAPADDRCFALVQADCLADDKAGGPNGNDTDRGGDSPAPGRRKWGIGGTLPANAVHGKRWTGDAEAGVGEGVGAATTGMLTASSSPVRGRGRGRTAAARERMGLETTSAEECSLLVDEINELVRRAGMKHGGGGSSSRGRDLFDEWVRSAAAAGRDDDAEAEGGQRACIAEATRSTPPTGDGESPMKANVDE